MSQMCSMPYPITSQGDCLMPAWRWIYKYSDLSAVAESQFSSFWVHRPWPKHCFCCFPLVGHGRKPIFVVFRSSAVDDERFSMRIDDFPPYLNSFFWKSAIYYRIWTVFSENRQFTIVSEQIFLKIEDLLPYLSGFSWKLMIYSRIWGIFLKLRRGSTAHPELEH